MRIIVKNSVKKLIPFLAAIISYAHTYGQTSGNDQMATTPASPKLFYPYVIEGAGELIYPLATYAVKDNFGGVYAGHISAQTLLIKRLYAGLEFQANELSEVAPNAFPIATAVTNMFLYNAGVKVSYYSSESGDWLFNCSIIVGESWISYNKVPVAPPPGGYGKQVIFLSSHIFEGYKVNDELCLGLELTYTRYNYSFDPNLIGVPKYYSPPQLSGPLSSFAWGFGIQYFIGKARS